jgi:hypothetical protein
MDHLQIPLFMVGLFNFTFLPVISQTPRIYSVYTGLSNGCLILSFIEVQVATDAESP